VGALIQAHLNIAADPELRITVVTIYEALAGAMDAIDSRRRQRRDLEPPFRMLYDLILEIVVWRDQIVAYESVAEQLYRNFPARLRQELGNDARIAAIALARDAAVWTCNVRDFARVPGLRVVRAETGMPVT
jgi:predicted nucleic acid-binding protein